MLSMMRATPHASRPSLASTSHRGGAGLRAAVGRAARRATRRAPVARGNGMVPQANELNKWANHDASDDIEGENESDYAYDRDTSKIVLRVLTARSAQRVLAQLGDTDLFVQKWFNDFLSENPPLKGDPFIQALFKERAVYMKDSVTGMEHFVSPAQLAHRILAMRELMARTVTAGFPEMVTRTNVDVLRQHLESSSYTSGTTSNTPAGGGGAADKGGRGRGGR